MSLRICATAAMPADASAVVRAAACEALGRLSEAVPEIAHSHASAHLEGSLGAGDLTWDFSVAAGEDARGLENRLGQGGWAELFAASAPEDRDVLGALSRIEAWRIEPLASHVPRADLVGIKRTNLVRVAAHATPESVAQWSREVVQLADNVPAIRNWSFARTHAFGPCRPRIAWTHAWEQEFETLEGLVEDYMASPYHWGWLDGWYDPEIPFCIVEPDLAHLYGRARRNVLGWTGSLALESDRSAP